MIALSQRALAAVNGRARADASTRRRAVRTNAWGTRRARDASSCAARGERSGRLSRLVGGARDSATERDDDANDLGVWFRSHAIERSYVDARATCA